MANTKQVKDISMELTEAERITFGIVFEKVAAIKAETERVNIALKGLIMQAIAGRGLDPTKFGVNMAMGRILPLDAPGGNGQKPNGPDSLDPAP